MKTLKLAASLLLILSAATYSGCTRDQNETFQSNTKEFISQGRWSVDYFFAGSDRTAQFSGCEFNFFGNGTLSGTNGTANFTGTWSVIRDVDYNDVLQLSIHTQDPGLGELNDQWLVTNRSNASISMMDDESQLRFRKL